MCSSTPAVLHDGGGIHFGEGEEHVEDSVTINSLPDELLQACFAELSATSLSRACRTSRRWCSVSDGLRGAHKSARIATIVAKLENSDSDVRQVAVQVLAHFDAPSLAHHAAEIIAKLKHDSKHVRRAAVDTLETLDTASLAEHAPAILATLEDDDAYMRQSALQTLGRLDAASLAMHATAVSARLQDPAPGVRRAAVVTLGNLGPTLLAMHAEAILVKLNDSVPYVRHAAAQTLGSLKKPNGSAINEVPIECVQHG